MAKKIFEFAKELEMGPLDLVEKLKGMGFTIRNHMSVLSDDDLTKFHGIVEAEKEASSVGKKTKSKKTTKKKVTKKKVTKKKVTTVKKGEDGEVISTAAASTPTTETTSEEVPKKKTTVRRRAVIRKKSSDTEETNESEVLEAKVVDDGLQSSDLSGVIESEVSGSIENSGSAEGEEGSGLRVVSRPESVVVKEEKGQETSSEVKTEEKSEIYKEKVHRFTPIFVPEKVEGKKTEEGTDDNKSSTTPNYTTAEGASKKRLGGLASMMSGKKVGVNRSQMLTQARADSELKSYAALSGSGRPVYSQIKKKRIYGGMTSATEITEVKNAKRIIHIHKSCTVLDLSHKLSVKFADLANDCLGLHLLVKEDDYVGIKLAQVIAALYTYRVEDKAFDEDKVLGKAVNPETAGFPLRDPIITIMGHVDHGKTTLLDYIRSEKVAASEAGGITQHIGAYSVSAKGKKLTFLDTPGHAAFASMRQRGADVTDIVILVVAADDGVMPQTKESIKFIQKSGVPLIVAINKMDKEGVNPDRIKQELAEFNITPEEWGGDVQMVPISALKGDGVDDLLEALAIQAEMMELRANPKGNVEGIVIESKIEQGRGPVATILIQSGTLKKGDSIVVGETYGRARSLTDHLGKQLKEAGPSVPVQILGLSSVPSPGESLNLAKNEREAKKVAENRTIERKDLESSVTKKKVSLEDFFAAAPVDENFQKTLNLIIRSDVQGSFEAIRQSLEALSNNEVEVKIIAGGVGAISDSDVNLAATAEGFLIGFNMRPVTSARKLAEQKGLDVKTYSIIYELIDDVKLAIEGLLEPDKIEEFIGRAEVKETFSVPRVGLIAGSVVIDGKIEEGCNIRLLRQGKILFDGKMSSLKRFKDDVKEVKNGYECGIGLEEFTDIKTADVFEAYMMIEKKRTLEDVAASEEKAKREKEKEDEEAALLALEAEAAAATGESTEEQRV